MRRAHRGQRCEAAGVIEKALAVAAIGLLMDCESGYFATHPASLFTIAPECRPCLKEKTRHTGVQRDEKLGDYRRRFHATPKSSIGELQSDAPFVSGADQSRVSSRKKATSA